jgi:hypothetical protein
MLTAQTRWPMSQQVLRVSLVLTFAFASIGIADALAAQPSKRWQEIGETSTGNKVYVDPKSISTKDSIITATVRVVYAKPSDTPKGPITGSRAVAMFNCASKKVAVKETIIWHDEAKGTMYEKRTPKIPGYGPVFTSNFSGVALKYLCESKGPSKDKV